VEGLFADSGQLLPGFAYCDLAYFRTGMPGSAFFHRAKRMSQAAPGPAAWLGDDEEQ
jgi:hypothetical protein